MARHGRWALALVIVLALGAGVAYADKTIYAGPPNQFIGGDITIDQGEKVSFTNVDTMTHDVTAKANGPDGKRLFASDKAGPGESKPVAGTEYLTTGAYNYECSIHPSMTGTITVTGNGTPAPRPGSGSGSPPPSSGGDKTAPSLGLKVADTKRATVRKRGALRVSVTTSEPATVGLTAKSGKTTVASGSTRTAKAGTKTVSLKLTKAGASLLKRSRTVKLSVSGRAADAAGNTSSASASGRLR